jgi:hypothetical protein
VSEYILSIDPGLSTGVSLLGYNGNAVWLEGSWQFGEGVTGFMNWFYDHTYDYMEGPQTFIGGKSNPRIGDPYRDWRDIITIVGEKFQPISHANYALTTASVEPLRVEGAMIALGLMPDYTAEEKRWRAPTLQYVAGGKSKPEKKKRLHQMLKDTDFYRTGKDLGAPDADDFRSATGHGLAYLARELKHKPTFELLTDWAEKN